MQKLAKFSFWICADIFLNRGYRADVDISGGSGMLERLLIVVEKLPAAVPAVKQVNLLPIKD